IEQPKEALKRGMFMLPEDRKLAGIFARLSVRENIILDQRPDAAEAARDRANATSGLPQHASLMTRAGFTPISPKTERRTFQTMQDALRIRCSGPDVMITSLSGGNQQKALFARAALANPEVLILLEPTRGVDIGAKEEIYAAIDKFAEQGVAILICSSEI